MKLKFKKANIAPLIFILGCCFIFLPFIFFKGTNLFEKRHYLTLIWIEFLMLAAIFLLWYKIFHEIIIARIEEGFLHYRRLFFLKKSIKIEDIKGYKTGSEETDFLVLYDKNDNKIFVIRLDFYENYYDFIDYMGIKEIGVYYTLFQKIIMKIFRKRY